MGWLWQCCRNEVIYTVNILGIVICILRTVICKSGCVYINELGCTVPQTGCMSVLG